MPIIDFTIDVDNPGDLLALFDRIQVWRAPTESGSYVDITADSTTPAVIDGTVVGPWAVSGQTLNIFLDLADPRAITFTGSNPLTLAQVKAQINAVFPNMAIETGIDTGKLRLISPISGTQSVLDLDGSAASTLGLTTAKVNGKGGRPLLFASTESYSFSDYDGAATYWYKTRYYSSVTGAVSTFSDPRQIGASEGLSSSFTVIGKIALADSVGSPIVERRIIFVPVAAQVINDGSGNNYGILPSVDRIIIFTDNNGRASTPLVKGQRLKVFIEGTVFQREFVVPTTDFDILTVASVQPDPLDIVTAPPMPIRVS